MLAKEEVASILDALVYKAGSTRPVLCRMNREESTEAICGSTNIVYAAQIHVRM